MKEFYIHYRFSCIYSGNKEHRTVGPFETRREANRYKKLSRPRSKDFVEATESSKVVTARLGDVTNYKPNEELMYRVWDELGM